jgi:1-acyl-sn-glycerol-3-phosphate acyltransferase
MRLAYWAVTTTIKGLTHLLCRVDGSQLAQVPEQGPLIIVTNHVNFLDVPVLYIHLQPRPLAGFAKAETWDNPALALLADLWGAIPLQRGEVDLSALRAALGAVEQGRILGVAPEGTRSGDGHLQAGQPGIVLLALRTQAPLLPVVTYGGEHFRRNLGRLRRTEVHVVVGRPFHLAPPAGAVTRQVRSQMTDEIMYQLATLLPPRYRGAYSDLDRATSGYLRFPQDNGVNQRQA